MVVFLREKIQAHLETEIQAAKDAAARLVAEQERERQLAETRRAALREMERRTHEEFLRRRDQHRVNQRKRTLERLKRVKALALQAAKEARYQARLAALQAKAAEALAEEERRLEHREKQRLRRQEEFEAERNFWRDRVRQRKRLRLAAIARRKRARQIDPYIDARLADYEEFLEDILETDWHLTPTRVDKFCHVVELYNGEGNRRCREVDRVNSIEPFPVYSDYSDIPNTGLEYRRIDKKCIEVYRGATRIGAMQRQLVEHEHLWVINFPGRRHLTNLLAVSLTQAKFEIMRFL